MRIGHVDLLKRRMLVAELGNNHEGDPALALELADAAVEAGADAIKVQIIDPARLVNISQAERLAQLARFRLDPEVVQEIARRARSRGRLFMASVFDCETLLRVYPELDAIKIASGDLDFDPMLELAAGTGKPIILSTGMSTMAEIRRALAIVAENLPAGAALSERLVALHCVSLYPTPLDAANLAAIPAMAAELGVTIGYSDHTVGIEAALIALSLGARVVEKHFTLDRTRAFRDHALSSDPAEFSSLARTMASFDTILGTGDRDDLPDNATRGFARRSIVASRALDRGDVLEATDIDYVRPADGMAPSEAKRLIGHRLRKGLAVHQTIQRDDVE